MIVAIAIVSTLVFILALHGLRVINIGRKVIVVAQRGVDAIRDQSLSDEEKEKTVQQASLSLAAAFGSIIVRGGLTLAASFVPIYLADRLGYASIEQVLSFLSRLDVIAVLSIVIIAGYVVGPRLWRLR